MSKTEPKMTAAPKPQHVTIGEEFIWNSRRSGDEVRIPLDVDYDLVEDAMAAMEADGDEFKMMRTVLAGIVPGGIRGRGLGVFEVQAMFLDRKSVV